MNNYRQKARTNYVKIKDIEALKASLNPFGCTLKNRKGSEEVSCILGNDRLGFSVCIEKDNSEFECFSFEKYVMPFVEEGEVLVAMMAGHQDNYYITGEAMALVRHADTVERVSLILPDIYAIAAMKFGKPVLNIGLVEH